MAESDKLTYQEHIAPRRLRVKTQKEIVFRALICSAFG